MLMIWEEKKVGGGGFMSAHVYLSLLSFVLELLQQKACFWPYRVKPFARLLELAIWSGRVVAFRQVYVRSLPTCLSLLCCGPPLLFGSSSISINTFR